MGSVMLFDSERVASHYDHVAANGSSIKLNTRFAVAADQDRWKFHNVFVIATHGSLSDDETFLLGTRFSFSSSGSTETPKKQT